MNESISKIIDRISDALNFFDFSFIVSGGLTFCFIYLTTNQINSFSVFEHFSTPIKIISSIGIIYICGLLSFAGGKGIRLWILNNLNKEKKFSTIFVEVL